MDSRCHRLAALLTRLTRPDVPCLPTPPSDLSHNQIASTTGLDGRLIRLQSLNLAHNQITNVEGVVGLPALQVLDVSSNQIPSTQRLRGLSLNTSLRVLRIEGSQTNLCEHESACACPATIQSIPVSLTVSC